MKKMTSEKKVTWGFNSIAVLMTLALIVTVHYVQAAFGLPTLVLYACFMPFLIGGLTLIYKLMKKTKWKDTIEKMDKKAEIEEVKSKPIPGIFGLALFVIICVGHSISSGISVIEEILLSNYEQVYLINELLPNCVGISTLLICSVLIAIIAYNVYKRNIFTYTNAKLIYSIGAIIILSVIIQNHYWDVTTMIPNDTVAINFGLLGVFILFFGRVFNIGAKIKEEQDLTI